MQYMERKNQLIRQRLKEAGVAQWQIADELRISEGVFCRRMRHELPEAEQQKILKIIDDLKGHE